MKYNININQKAAFEVFGTTLDIQALAVLDYCIDYISAQFNKLTLTQDNKIYTWIQYENLINEMPLLGTTSKSRISDIMKKLIENEALECIKQGKHNFYKTTKKTDLLKWNKDNNIQIVEQLFGKQNDVVRKTEQESFGKQNTIINIKDYNINTIKKEKNSFSIPSLEDVIKYFNENGFGKELAIKFFKSYEVANWFDTKGNKVKNWKQKAIQVWFKDENKINQPVYYPINSYQEMQKFHREGPPITRCKQITHYNG